jgi:hypothetical protein
MPIVCVAYLGRITSAREYWNRNSNQGSLRTHRSTCISPPACLTYELGAESGVPLPDASSCNHEPDEDAMKITAVRMQRQAKARWQLNQLTETAVAVTVTPERADLLR